jgi:hypothetical protein
MSNRAIGLVIVVGVCVVVGAIGGIIIQLGTAAVGALRTHEVPTTRKATS